MKLKRIGFFATFFMLASSASGASIIQIFSFYSTQSGAGPANFTLFPSGFSTGNNVRPFDSYRGMGASLTSFFVDWDINFDLRGMSSDTGGGGDGTAGGTYSLAGIGYDGNGGGFGEGIPPGLPFHFGFEVADPKGFGIPAIIYDPRILAAVEGGSDFALSWGAPYTGIVNAASWTASAIGQVSITYNYIPAPTPEPSSAFPLLLGLAVMAKVRWRH